MRTCAVCIEKDEANVAEWLRWHLLVDQFDAAVVFEDGKPADVPPGLRDRVFQVPTASLPGCFMRGQAVQFRAYNHFLRNMAGDFDAAAFLDMDEYLVLHGIKAADALPAFAGAAAVSFSWAFYGSRLSEGPDASLALRFRHRARLTDRHCKVMLDLEACRRKGAAPLFNHPHFAHYGSGGIMTAAAPDGEAVEGPFKRTPYDPALFPYVAHFYSKTEREFRAKVARGRPDTGPGSSEQYYRQEEKMLKLRAERDINEVEDQELARGLEGAS